MSWWGERKKTREEATQASLVATLAQALGTALGQVFTAQAHQIEQSSKFLDSLQDLSARKAAQIMGSRGGRTTQRRKAERKRDRLEAPACVLCANTMHRGVTLEQIAIHRQHEGVNRGTG